MHGTRNVKSKCSCQQHKASESRHGNATFGSLWDTAVELQNTSCWCQQHKMYLGLSACKVPDINQINCFSTDFRRSLQYQLSRKSVRRGRRSHVLTRGRPDRRCSHLMGCNVYKCDTYRPGVSAVLSESYCQIARNLIRKLMSTLRMSGNMRHGTHKLRLFFGDVTPCSLA
jgi:hypothetical protein